MIANPNEPALMLFRWFWVGATPKQQAGILKDAPDQDREKLLAAMTPERRELVEPLLRKHTRA